MYEISKDKAFYIALKYLSFVTAIPTKFQKSHRSMFVIKYVFVKLFGCLMFLILPGMHLIGSITDHTGTDISEDISFMISSSGSMATSIKFAYKYKQWSSFLTDLDSFNQFGRHPKYEKLKKQLYLYCIIFILYVYVGTSIYSVIALLQKWNCEDLNQGNGLHEICGTILPVKLPFEVTNVFVKILISTSQYVMCFYSICPGAVICLLIFEAEELIVSHLNRLKYLFEHVFDDGSEEEIQEKLGFCIKYHVHILRFCKRFNKLVKFTAGHMSLICAMVFGCIGNQVLKTNPIGALIHLVGYATCLFMLCYAGQRVLDETLSVTDAVYNSKWYDVDVKFMKDITFILARCQIPSCLDALPLGTFNYPLFLMIMKTSYTYLTLLQQST